MNTNTINKKILILGSTGSVGTQAADVSRSHSLNVDGICASTNIKILEEQIREFHPRYCAVVDVNAAKDLAVRVADTNTVVLSGIEGVVDMINLSDAEIAVNSIMGRAGLEPTLAIIRSGKDLALANKETLVTAGHIVMGEARKYGVNVLPVDSEHCAIFQCLRAGNKNEVSRLILTASGGPFYGKSFDQLSEITVEMALAHPTWKMGAKITIDSATMMNKGFEVIEACHLFGVSVENVDVVVHRESIIHSMVEYIDGSVIAQLAVPDMRMCVHYAMTYPNRGYSTAERLDFAKLGNLSFLPPDNENFPMLNLAREAFKMGGIIPCVLNGANEAAVSLFLNGKIKFTEISKLVKDITLNFNNINKPTLAEIAEADIRSRKLVNEAANI